MRERGRDVRHLLFGGGSGGIVALMLQREPGLTPDKVCRVLLATARDLGAKGRDPLLGAGFADAYGVLMAEDGPVAAAAPLPVRASTGAR
jgi:hypothetical protein